MLVYQRVSFPIFCFRYLDVHITTHPPFLTGVEMSSRFKILNLRQWFFGDSFCGLVQFSWIRNGIEMGSLWRGWYLLCTLYYHIGIILWLSTILHLISCDIIHFLHIIFDLFCIAGRINFEPQFGMVCWFDFEWLLLTLLLCSTCFGRPRKLPKNQVCG